MTKRILLVDDERSIRESLSKILGAENYEVVPAGNGQEAIEKHAGERIDLLILDLNMPVKNGWDTLEWLVGINPLLPVVIITGRSNQSALAKTAGAAVLMEKPLDVPLLLQTIRELLTERRALLETTARRLLEKETLDEAELLQLVSTDGLKPADRTLVQVEQEPKDRSGSRSARRERDGSRA